MIRQTGLAQAIDMAGNRANTMISEQYGTIFTNEHYEEIQKVYSIWICPDPAKKRKN